MKQPAYLSIVNICARSCLALVFIVAAVSKLLAMDTFVQRVGDFGLVYDPLVKPTAWAVVVAELLLGIALILQLKGSLVAAVVLLVTFVGVLAYGVALGLDIECGCFGPAVHVNLETQLITDFGLLLICAIIYGVERHRRHARVASADASDSSQRRSS